MKLWLSAETESSVYEDLRHARNSLEDELASFLESKQYEIELDSLNCIIILRNDDVFEEITRYSAKKRDMDFRLAIDFNEFTNSDFNQRKSLILETVIRAVDILSAKKSINKEAVQALRNDIINFGNRNGILSI